jgi:hypothetical protein
MADIISLALRREALVRREFSYIPMENLLPCEFSSYEIGVFGQIRSSFLCNGFSCDPILQFGTSLPTVAINNKATISIDVKNPAQKEIFGEFFEISVCKFLDKNNQAVFNIALLQLKSSGAFDDVIHFIENFVNTNLEPNQRPIGALLRRTFP